MTAKRQAGFTLLELMVVLVILTIVMGVVFNTVAHVQIRYRTEEQRLDVTQSSREFMDQIARDLRNIGYPNQRMFGAGVLSSPVVSSVNVAAGLVAASATDIWFEGDIDGTGQVSSVRYTLAADTNGNCPCTLKRSSVYKAAGAPSGQALSYSTELSNVVNSIGGTSPWTITGTAPSGSSNDSVYGGYKTTAVFQFFDSSNNPVTVPDTLSGTNLATGVSAASNVAYITVTVNVLAAFPDAQTGLRPAATMRTTIRLTNL